MSLYNYVAILLLFSIKVVIELPAFFLAARFEVGFVSSFRRFNIEFQCFTGLKGNTVHRSEIERVWDKEWIGAIFKEAARLQDLHLTYPENVIFSAIVLLFRGNFHFTYSKVFFPICSRENRSGVCNKHIQKNQRSTELCYTLLSNAENKPQK